MAIKPVYLKMDETDVYDIKTVAGIYNMSMTDLIKNAVKEYLAELKSDPFYKLTTNIQEASVEESQEILDTINSLSDDDLTIASAKQFSV